MRFTVTSAPTTQLRAALSALREALAQQKALRTFSLDWDAHPECITIEVEPADTLSAPVHVGVLDILFEATEAALPTGASFQVGLDQAT